MPAYMSWLCERVEGKFHFSVIVVSPPLIMLR